jgi:hypothetical protein
MYARLVTGSIPSDKLDEAIQFWRNTVLPSVQQQKGFRSVRLLVDRKTAKLHRWACGRQKQIFKRQLNGTKTKLLSSLACLFHPRR